MGTHSKIEALDFIRKEVEHLFAKCGGELEEVRVRAEAVSSAIETAGLFIERHTSAVCPRCPEVCCINRHSYHELADVVCIYALGQRLPVYEKGTGDTEPCQFLGEKGCGVGRSLRPHRCNWYFCTPLLEHIQTVPARAYRMFIAGLREINGKREDLLNTFSNVLKGAGYDVRHLRRASDEIFFTQYF
jgi:hypothetical protein